MHSKPCQRQLLAHGSVASVEECGCGIVHVTVGPLSLRLQATAMSELANTLTQAVESLDYRRRQAADDLRLMMYGRLD